MKYKKYFLSTWLQYFQNTLLNYIYINRIQRTNSYIENYNHRIRIILGPFYNKIGISIIRWPLFLSFIIEEEHFYKTLLIDLDSKDLSKKRKFNSFIY